MEVTVELAREIGVRREGSKQIDKMVHTMKISFKNSVLMKADQAETLTKKKRNC